MVEDGGSERASRLPPPASYSVHRARVSYHPNERAPVVVHLAAVRLRKSLTVDSRAERDRSNDVNDVEALHVEVDASLLCKLRNGLHDRKACRHDSRCTYISRCRARPSSMCSHGVRLVCV